MTYDTIKQTYKVKNWRVAEYATPKYATLAKGLFEAKDTEKKQI